MLLSLLLFVYLYDNISIFFVCLFIYIIRLASLLTISRVMPLGRLKRRFSCPFIPRWLQRKNCDGRVKRKGWRKETGFGNTYRSQQELGGKSLNYSTFGSTNSQFTNKASNECIIKEHQLCFWYGGLCNSTHLSYWIMSWRSWIQTLI